MRELMVLAVVTYERPQELERLICSLGALQPVADLEIRVLVGNNSRSPLEVAAQGRFTALELGFERRISAARDALMSAAADMGAAYIAYLDDDEVVSPNWLVAIWCALREEGVAGVAGPVIPSGVVPPRLVPLFERRRHQTGDVVQAAGAGNLALRLDALRGVRFDPAWGEGAGEDTDFSLRLTECGGVILWSDDALVWEPTDSRRLRTQWLVRRYFRNGATLARVRRGRQPATAPELLARAVSGLVLTLFVPAVRVRPSLGRRVLELGPRNLGFVLEHARAQNLGRHQPRLNGPKE